jgi:hypothetical protein
MRAPDPARRSAGEVFGQIKRLDGLTLDRESERFVRQIITALSTLEHEPPTWGNRAVNSKYLENLNTKIHELIAMLGAPPNVELSHALFSELDLWTLSNNRLLTLIDALEGTRQEARIKCQDLIGALADLRIRSDHLIDNQAGEHGSAGYQQFRAALAARLVLLKTGGKIANENSQSLYRQLGSLFLEVITGKEGRDVGERACDRALGVPVSTGTEKPQIF